MTFNVLQLETAAPDTTPGRTVAASALVRASQDSIQYSSSDRVPLSDKFTGDLHRIKGVSFVARS
jgi:hypothetical protein